MSIEKQIQDGLRQLSKRGVDTFSAKVTEVDKTKGFCTVEADGLEYADVRLASVLNERESFVYVFPKLGSSVLVSPIEEDLNNLYVEAYSEVEEFYLKVDTTEMNVNADGILIKRENENLRNILDDWQKEFGKLCDEVNKIVVSIGVTPNVAAITLIKTEVTTTINNRLKKVLKEE